MPRMRVRRAADENLPVGWDHCPVVYTQVWSLTFWPKAYFTVALGNAQGSGVPKYLLAVGHNHPMVAQDT